MIKYLKLTGVSMVYLFLYLPIVVLMVNSFNQNRFGIHWGGLSGKWYEALLYNDTLIEAAQHSIVVALCSASAATLLGGITAIALYRYRFKGKTAIHGLLFVVMMSPDILMAISLLALFLIIGIPLGFFTLFIAHITFCLPFVVITLSSRLNGFDISMLEAAKDLGASESIIIQKIILPLIMPAVVAAWLLSFTLSLDDVIISAFVTGPTYEILPLKIYSMVKVGISPEVNALATIMLVFSFFLILLSQRLMKEK